MTRLAAFAVLALAACAPRSPEPGTTVRHFASTEPYGSARWHVFVFDPARARDLDTRIDIARSAIASEPRLPLGGRDAGRDRGGLGAAGCAGHQRAAPRCAARLRLTQGLARPAPHAA